MNSRIWLVALIVATSGCGEVAPVPGMERLPRDLAPYARKIAESRLPHVDVMPVIGPTALKESKLRGLPYYPKDRPWPADPEGTPLAMLVQINFAEMPALDGYPDKGILQIYVSAGYDPETQMWGMCNEDGSLACATDQSYFRTVYFADPSLHATQLITEIPKVTYDAEYGFPADEEARLEFKLASSYVRPEDYRFRRFFGQDGSKFFDYRKSELEEAYEEFMGGRHYVARIGGYSRVEQMDPRLEYPDDDWLLLFSLDSEGSGDYGVGWGDGGVGNFYIRRADLLNRDFSKVMYYWDCG
jgi:uncharacterized protein YwqG